MAAAPEPGTVEQELAAMRRICAALDQLDEPSRRRVMRYLVDRYPDANLDGPVLTGAAFEGHTGIVRYAGDHGGGDLP